MPRPYRVVYFYYHAEKPSPWGEVGAERAG